VWLPPAKGFLSEEFVAMDGLGALYSRVSTYVFGHWNKCGEVMGLASYGRDSLPPLVRLEGDDLRFTPWDERFVFPFEGGSDAEWEASPHRTHWEDLAWRVQRDVEDVLLERARRLAASTGSRRLAMAGGVALNCVANGRLLLEGPFEELFVQPAAGDDGIALGCALYGDAVLRGHGRRWRMEHAYLGAPYDEARVADALRGFGTRLALARRRPADLAEETADLLAAGRVVGWFQGGSEFGPRALGNRSILADPRDTGMRDRVNARVKHRQAFRPFAPVVLAERAREWFEIPVDSPYMLLAGRVRPEMRSRVPAIVHVDGTARVQTLRRETNPRLYALIEAFARRTGVPLLLNTSFNDRGEPLVETPQNAVDCFLGTELDALAIHDRLLVKRGAWRLLRPLGRRLRRVRAALDLAAWRRRAAEAVRRREGG
jgi:carbamoyltransferase